MDGKPSDFASNLAQFLGRFVQPLKVRLVGRELERFKQLLDEHHYWKLLFHITTSDVCK
jgi:hypothetical protein